MRWGYAFARAVLGAQLLASGCIHARATKIATDDGSTRYRIDCEEPNECGYKADDVCPDGYVALGSVVKKTGTEATTVVYAPTSNLAFAKTEVHDRIHLATIIECKGPGGTVVSHTDAPAAAAKTPPSSPISSGEDDDTTVIKGRDSESGVSFSFTIPSDWKFTTSDKGEKAWSSPKSTHGAWMIVKPWGGTAKDFAAKMSREGDRYYDAKIEGRVAWMLEAHPDSGGTATSAIFVIDGSAFMFTCMDVIGDETSKVCLRVLKSLRLDEP